MEGARNHVGKLNHGIVARMSACEIRGRIPVEMVHLSRHPGKHRQWVDAGTRLTKAFSRKVENHDDVVSLHAMY